jgi:hypothetical protein
MSERRFATPWSKRNRKQTAMRIFNGQMGGAQLVGLSSWPMVELYAKIKDHMVRQTMTGIKKSILEIIAIIVCVFWGIYDVKISTFTWPSFTSV